MFGLNPENIVRKRIKADLPSILLNPIPWRVLWYFPWCGLIGCCWWALLNLELNGFVSLIVSVLIGNAFGVLGFLSHEVSHGAMVKHKGLQKFFAGVGFAPFLLTPAFWHRWHNIAHHGNTNMSDRDPDSFGTLKRYERNPSQKALLLLAPGSGTWYSYLFLFYSFTLHSQAVLWLQTKHRKAFQGFNRKAAIRNMLLLALGWILLTIALGPWGAVFGILIPMLIGNAVIQGYILTNHFLRPQTKTNSPVDNSMSVKTTAWLDKMHFHFSHHVEHHLFPTMPSCHAPKLRSWLQQHLPNSYLCPPHWLAIQYLYKTPRVYLNANTLVDVNQPTYQFNLQRLQEKWIPSFQSLSDLAKSGGVDWLKQEEQPASKNAA